LKPLPQDIDLVDMLQKGNIEAFDLLYKRYASRIYHFGLKYLRSHEESRELVQAVYLSLWENHKKLRKESSFKSFLFTITYNKICNIFKEREHHKKFITEKLLENINVTTDTEDQLLYKSTLEQVNKIIDLLPEKQRAIFIKSKIESKSSREIADELGLSSATIDNYISECLKFIRKRCKIENISHFLFFILFFI
jgi:RNA polymerase sigma-70 factor (ECF subfamily)